MQRDGGPTIDDWSLLSASQIGETHTRWCKVFSEVDQEEDEEPGWDVTWIPFAASNTGDCLCVLTTGEVLLLDHADTRRPRIARSIAESVQRLARGLA